MDTERFEEPVKTQMSVGPVTVRAVNRMSVATAKTPYTRLESHLRLTDYICRINTAARAVSDT